MHELQGCDHREVLGPWQMWGTSTSIPRLPGATHQSPPPLEGTDEGPQSPQQVGLNEEEQGEVDAP